MHVSSSRLRRYWIFLLGLSVVVALTQAQTAVPRAAQAGDALVRQVRSALGHGNVEEAQRLVSTAAVAPSRELAAALVEIYRGDDTGARARLQALVDKGTRGEAALELGLLEMRYHHRDVATRLLDPLTRQNLNTPDDYFLLARAARAIGEFQLATDAYERLTTTTRPEVFAEYGDMWYQRHKNGDAVAEYQKALKRDDQWVNGHLGLSRALAQDEPEEAVASLEAAKKIAPESPDVWLLTAERALEAEDAAASRTALEHVAKGRPGTVQEAALRAGIAYLERKLPEVDAAIARVKQIDPLSTLGYRVAGQEAARKYRFADAAEYARKAVALDAGDALAQAELGLYLLRTGDEVAARVALETSWATDKSDAITKNLLAMLDELDKFEVVADGDMIYKFAKGEAAVLKPYALPLGQLAYTTFSERYGFKPAGPILIEVFDRHDDFAVRTVGLMGLTGALGACFGRVVTMDSPSARPPGDFSWQATQWHEMAHVFTLQLSEYRVPRWLTEGLSTYEEHRRVAAWGRELTLEFAHNLAVGKTFGVKKLPEAFKHPETLSLAYFEASLLVEHLTEIAGDQGVRTLLRAYADGATDTEAFSRAFGKDIDTVETSFAAFVKLHYGPLSAAMADPPGPKVESGDLDALRTRATAAPGNFIAQHGLGRALLQSGDFAGAKPVLERAARLAPQALGNTSPHALLADIAEHDGDNGRARSELRALLLYDHTNVGAARRLAKLAAQSQSSEDLDTALRLVADLEPFDVEVHSLLGRRELAKGRKAEAVIEFQAALALRPPNLAEAHTDLGEALLSLGRRDEARKEALLALNEAPAFARAQDLLLAASGKH